jgi:hypothetical protein
MVCIIAPCLPRAPCVCMSDIVNVKLSESQLLQAAHVSCTCTCRQSHLLCVGSACCLAQQLCSGCWHAFVVLSCFGRGSAVHA